MRWALSLRGDPDGPAHSPQFFATLSACMGSLCIGTLIGYASPATYQLGAVNASYSVNEAPIPSYYNSLNQYNISEQSSYLDEHSVYSDNNSITLDRHQGFSVDQTVHDENFIPDASQATTDDLVLTSTQLSWFSSVFSIGAAFGGLLSGPLMKSKGTRGTLLVSFLPCIVGWLLIGFGVNFSMLLAGRILTGIFTGFTSVSCVMYIGEIASNDIRGVLGTGYQLMIGFGILYAYIFGAFMKWDILAFVCCIPLLLFGIMMFFTKESPAYLLAQGREQQAKEALQYFRGAHYDISAEFAQAKQFHKEAAQKNTTLSDLRKPYILKPLIIVVFLLAFLQLSGVNALSFNMTTIFQSAGISMSANACSIIVGVVQAVAPVFTIFLVETAGRRFLYISSAVISAMSQGCLGLFFYLVSVEEEWTMQYLSWLPMVAMNVFYIAFSFGLGPIPWILLCEVLPPEVKETAGALATSINWSVSFFVVYSFEPLQLAIKSYGCYWIFAGFCAIAAVFAATVVKETKGKSLIEISEMFK